MAGSGPHATQTTSSELQTQLLLNEVGLLGGPNGLVEHDALVLSKGSFTATNSGFSGFVVSKGVKRRLQV